MNLDDVAFLTSSAGERLLSALHEEDLSDAALLRLIPRLRKTHTPKQTSAAIETTLLRRDAIGKFGDDAAHMLFTRDALQQASDPLVRTYRARGMEGLEVADAGSSIGSDSIALARVGAAVTGVDSDPVRVAMAQHNAQVCGVDARFVVGDIREDLPTADVVFFDPARRDARGNRIYDVDRYIPPLSLIHNWPGRVIAKLSPGVDLSQLAAYPGAVEFVSVNGDLKEAILRRPGEGNRATLLSENNALHYDDAPQPDVLIEAPRGWLIEPDPALLRAGFVRHIAAELDGALLDENIAYFTANSQPQTPWVRAWPVEAWLPFNLKKLRAVLRECDVGRVTVKKRGSPLEPDDVVRKLKLKGTEARVLVLTRLRNDPIVLICHES